MYDMATALDSVYDDIMAYGESPELLEMEELIRSHGGKPFKKLVPEFFDA